MEKQALLLEAESGRFFSYAAGIAYQFLVRADRGVGRPEIDNYYTDLPIQKGLSSSAAICVWWQGHLTKCITSKCREEMEIAYLAEIATPSPCGRMDQACAYGNRSITVIFDGDRTDIIELSVPKDLFFVIDLGARKNTQKILKALNECYPFAYNQVQANVQKYLGFIDYQITQAAIRAIEKRQAQQIGILIKQAQEEFDRHLTAPALHQLLNHQPI